MKTEIIFKSVGETPAEQMRVILKEGTSQKEAVDFILSIRKSKVWKFCDMLFYNENPID